MTQTLTKNKNQVLLTKEEERVLISKSQEGSKKALRLLVSHNQGLVHKIVHRFPLKNNQCSYDDLFQVGMMGFIHAVDKFDLSSGNRLSTYSYRWIHAFVRRYYQNQARVVRIPAHLADKKYQMDVKVRELTQRNGSVPSPEELELLVPGYASIAALFSHTVSLNKELESGEELIDIQSDDNRVDSDTVLQVNSLLDLLKPQVSERDYEIFITRYGVDGQAEHTFSEVADKFGLTRARVHQVSHHCLEIIRHLAD